MPNVSRAVRDALAARVEHKRIIAVGAYSDLATAGIVNAITQSIAQGDDISNRSGDTILLESVRLRVVMLNTSSTQSEYLGRWILFSDSQDTGAVPTVTEILASADPLSGYNTLYKQSNRFKVYADKMMPMISETNFAMHTYDITFKVNKRVHYTGSSGASSNGKNSFYALFITDTASAGSVRYKWSYELQYTDS